VCIKQVALSVNRYPRSSSELHKGWCDPCPNIFFGQCETNYCHCPKWHSCLQRL